MSALKRGSLPEHIEKIRSHIGIDFKKIHNPVGVYGARTYSSLGYDNSLNTQDFRETCIIRISHFNDEEVIFDIINVDAPIANALRRLLLVEVPSMAIEIVNFHNNTSVMHDEMLAHRLGLVPLNVDPRPFETWTDGDPVTAKNTVKFKLKVKCELNRDAPKDTEVPPDLLYKNHKVFTSALEYVPVRGQEVEQAAMFGNRAPGPVHEDILLCKLRPGQELDLEMEARKSIGKDHAKWSPVCTAAYRMLPEVNFRNEVTGEDALELKNLCPAKVFDIEDDSAIVARPRDCTMCRECIREPRWAERVELSRKRSHFIFHVESVGGLPANTLVTEALTILMTKCDTVLSALDTALQRVETATEKAEGNTEAAKDENDEDIDMEVG